MIMHELGHLVGRTEIFGDSADVMGIALSTGERRLPTGDFITQSARSSVTADADERDSYGFGRCPFW